MHALYLNLLNYEEHARQLSLDQMESHPLK